MNLFWLYLLMIPVTFFGIWGLNMVHTILEHILKGVPMKASDLSDSNIYLIGSGGSVDGTIILFCTLLWPIGLSFGVLFFVIHVGYMILTRILKTATTYMGNPKSDFGVGMVVRLTNLFIPNKKVAK